MAASSASPSVRGPPSLLGAAWQRYLLQLNKHPLRTKALTSAFIAGLSDVAAQGIINGRHTSWRRTLALACYGLIWNGPSAHYWQRFLEVLFKGKSDIGTVLRKVLVDQSTYGPLCNILFMSFATLVLEGRTLAYLKDKIRRDYVLVQLNGWKLWPLAALINYKFVPLQFRVLFVNVVALCWSIFLLVKARSTIKAAAPPSPPAGGPGAGAKKAE